MIGTDSHTPNAGGSGMTACGVGGADAVDVRLVFHGSSSAPKSSVSSSPERLVDGLLPRVHSLII